MEVRNMRLLKRVFGRCLCFGLSLSLLAVGAPQVSARADAATDYKILVWADVHLKGEYDPQLETFMNEAIANVHPNLVVFLGDTLNHVFEEVPTAIDELFRPLIENKTYFTFVMGNHEDVPEDVSFAALEGYGENRRVALTNLFIEHGGGYYLEPDISNTGVYGVDKCYDLKNPETGEVWTQIFCFDPGSNDGSGYDWVRKPQIDWFKSVARPGVPKLVFQHISVREIMTAFPKVANTYGIFSKNVNGQNYFLLPNYARLQGSFQEGPCPGDGSDGQFDALVEDGDVMALVTGHDHYNNFKEPLRGCSLFTLNPQTPGEYTWRLYTYAEAAKVPGSKITQTMKKDASFEYSGALVHYLQYIPGAFMSLFRWLYPDMYKS
jgi:predicted phosphodiesterase